jgi:hypothetical protein
MPGACSRPGFPHPMGKRTHLRIPLQGPEDGDVYPERRRRVEGRGAAVPYGWPGISGDGAGARACPLCTRGAPVGAKGRGSPQGGAGLSLVTYSASLALRE